jgi:hypothetical protein
MSITTWGAIFWKYVRKGHDRSSAAYEADRWEARQQSERPDSRINPHPRWDGVSHPDPKAANAMAKEMLTAKPFVPAASRTPTNDG